MHHLLQLPGDVGLQARLSALQVEPGVRAGPHLAVRGAEPGAGVVRGGRRVGDGGGGGFLLETLGGTGGQRSGVRSYE